MRCFWFTVDFLSLNPFPNRWYRAAFDILMLWGGLSLVYILVVTGVVR